MGTILTFPKGVQSAAHHHRKWESSAAQRITNLERRSREHLTRRKSNGSSWPPARLGGTAARRDADSDRISTWTNELAIRWAPWEQVYFQRGTLHRESQKNGEAGLIRYPVENYVPFVS